MKSLIFIFVVTFSYTTFSCSITPKGYSTVMIDTALEAINNHMVIVQKVILKRNLVSVEYVTTNGLCSTETFRVDGGSADCKFKATSTGPAKQCQ
jgi:hypothetical protein